MAWIRYIDDGVERFFQLPEDKMVLFGREDYVDFQILSDAKISREHFGIEKDESGSFTMIELGATNGTYLNGKRLENETVKLKQGDRIKAGSCEFVFLEKDIKHNATNIFKSVAQELGGGKGFKTMMSEIVGNNNFKKSDK